MANVLVTYAYTGMEAVRIPVTDRDDAAKKLYRELTVHGNSEKRARVMARFGDGENDFEDGAYRYRYFTE